MNKEAQQYFTDLEIYLRTLLSKGVEQAEALRPEWHEGVDGDDPAGCPELLQRFLDQALAAYSFQKQIASGDISQEMNTRNMLAMPLKGLQASLRHLAWQAEQVAAGDYNQTVHFLGGFSHSFNAMTEALKEKERLQAETNQLQSQLFQAQKMEAVGRLAAGMAHEINTPAHFIGINLEFLGQAFEDIALFIEQTRQVLLAPEDEQAQAPASRHQLATTLAEIDWAYLAEEIPKALSQSQGGIARVATIVSSLKELAQPGRLGSERVDLNQLIEETAAISTDEWNRVVEITTDLDAAVPPVVGTESQLRQVLFNLIANGAQAVEEKMAHSGSAEKGFVRIHSRLLQDKVELLIEDTGTGIRPEDLTKIFDPFFTTKEVGRGTGQGLTVVHDVVVNKHGGTLEVSSIPGIGTTFSMYLPLFGIHP